jgi:hypothetical protein
MEGPDLIPQILDFATRNHPTSFICTNPLFFPIEFASTYRIAIHFCRLLLFACCSVCHHCRGAPKAHHLCCSLGFYFHLAIEATLSMNNKSFSLNVVGKLCDFF